MQKRRWNERTRLTLLLELAVVLPAAALILASALHLRSIQQDRAVEAAIQRDFQQVLAITANQMDTRAIALLDHVRQRFPTPNEACTSGLDMLLASHPYLAHAFIYSPGTGFVFRSQPVRLHEADFREEADGLQKMFMAWMRVEGDDLGKNLAKMEKNGKPYEFFPTMAPRGDKSVYQSGALFLERDPGSGKRAICGVVFDAEFLRNSFFPGVMENVLLEGPGETASEKTHAEMGLYQTGEPDKLAVAGDWDNGPAEVERNLQTVFPGLTLGIKLHGTTVAALGQRFVRSSFLTLGALSLLLAGGIFLTFWNVSREMALARLKSDFVSNVSHELRTPLSLIRLYAETLELGRVIGEGKRQEYFRIIRKESERLTGLINNILDFSRIEAGGKEYDFRETDIGELVRNTLESYRYQIEQSGFTFEEEISSNLPPVRVDREAIARSLLNLVNNSLKYSRDSKYLRVNLYRDNGSVKLEVIDRGIGIPRHEQRRIFEKFYRAGDPLVHNTKGSGLGLALVRHIVQAHHGDIQVNSDPGQGSRFVITLPAEPPQPGNGAAAM